MIDREKQIKYLMFEKGEAIKLLKKDIKNLRKELDDLNRQKTLKRKRGK